jgi:hypothetical protein
MQNYWTAILSFIHAVNDTRDRDILERRHLPLPELANDGKDIKQCKKAATKFFLLQFGALVNYLWKDIEMFMSVNKNIKSLCVYLIFSREVIL